MTIPDHSDCEQALVDLVAELTEIARPPAHTDPTALRRVNAAFGRVRDAAPDTYRSNRSLLGFHAETDYFASDGEPSAQLPLFSSGTESAAR